MIYIYKYKFIIKDIFSILLIKLKNILKIKKMSLNHNFSPQLYLNTEIINNNTSNYNSTKQNLTKVNNEFYKINYPNIISEGNIINNSQNILKTKSSSLKKQNSQNQIQNNNYIDISEYLGKEGYCPLTLDILDMKIKNFEPGKTSNKNMGIIKSYAANTHEGLIRNYNEDRVSIIINMSKPKNYKIESKGKWPKVSYFAIYDGHGGKNCAEYLRDNLHQYICNDINFPNNIPEAIKNGFNEAENDFLNNIALSKLNNNVNDRSGSCAVVILIVNNKIYVANVGDSRCIMSIHNGKNLREITIDHKPNEINEKDRILKNGGKVYQSQTPLNNNNLNQILIGPFRVFPGRLSVSRTIGDVEAKNIKFGGNPNVIIASPDIYVFDIIDDDVDFLILGCDGIFDQINNIEIFNSVWMIIHHFCKCGIDNHSLCGKVVDYVLKAAMTRKSFDNVTCLIVAFKDFGDKNVFGKDFYASKDINNDKKFNNENNKNVSLESNNISNEKNSFEKDRNFNKKNENKEVKKYIKTNHNYMNTNNNNSNNNNSNNNYHNENNINRNNNNESNIKEINKNNEINNLPQKYNLNEKNNNTNKNESLHLKSQINNEKNNIINKNESLHLKSQINNEKNKINTTSTQKNNNIKSYNIMQENNYQQARYTQRENTNIFHLAKNNVQKSVKLTNNNEDNNNNNLNNNINVNNTEKYTPKIMNKRYTSSKNQINGFHINNIIIENKNNNNHKFQSERALYQFSLPKNNPNLNTEPNNTLSSFNVFSTPKNTKMRKSFNNGTNFRKKKDLTIETNDNYFMRYSIPKYNTTTSKDNAFLSYTVGKNYGSTKTERNDLWK